MKQLVKNIVHIVVYTVVCFVCICGTLKADGYDTLLVSLLFGILMSILNDIHGTLMDIKDRLNNNINKGGNDEIKI